MQLNNLGWSESFARSFESYASQGLSVGRVALAHRGQYHLYTETGECSAALTGKFRHLAKSTEDFPAVGDWVVIQPATETSQALIESVLPRRGKVSRQAAGSKSEAQVIAANIATLFLVSGLDHDFNLRRIERYLVMAWQSGATPVILLNKADLCEGPEEKVEEKIIAVEEIAISVPIIPLSALHQNSLDALNPYLQPGKTVALLGSSGVGKSPLTNKLIGHNVQPTQAVRADDSRGRHTTTHREMLKLPSGALLIDMPGMRELQLWTDPAQLDNPLDETFSDIESLAKQCRFRNCQHGPEPGCAIQAALEDGTLCAKRFNSYQKLQREQDYQHRRQDKQAQSNTKARWKHITKMVRQQQRD
mgnify:CR=1 FL=1